jgi:ATP-dependent RNA helicase RhlB
MKFSDLQMAPEILRGIGDAGFTDCTPVQAETFKHSFLGKDVCVQSQTGTGKTAAYLLTIFKLFTENMVRTKKALIMVPTRELAVQIEKETALLGKYLGLKSATFFGGVGYGPQEQSLREGVDIMIATPGRLIDLYKSGKVTLGEISVLIIDEADRMFDMGFIPDIRYLIKKMPGSKDRRTLLFSATLSQKVKSLAWEYMHDPAEVEIMPEQVAVNNVTQTLYHVGNDEKMRLLLGILKKYNPNNAIIFTNMKRTAETLSKKLTANGYKNEFIMGDLPQRKRLSVIEGVKSGKIKFLVATDVAARGLHVDDLDMVVNFDIPEDCENYVHRIGRTARAGKSGLAVSLACERYVQGLEGIEAYLGMKIPVEWYDDDMLVEDASYGMRFERERKPRAHGGRSEREGFGGRARSGGRGDRKGSDKREHRSDRKPHRDHTERKDRQHQSAKPAHSASRPHEHSASAAKPHTMQSHKPRHQEHKTHDQKRHEHKPDHKTKSVVQNKKVTAKRDGTIEERVAYYRQKYGDNFRITDDMLRDDRSKKKTVLQKIKSLFKK